MATSKRTPGVELRERLNPGPRVTVPVWVDGENGKRAYVEVTVNSQETEALTIQAAESKALSLGYKRPTVNRFMARETFPDELPRIVRMVETTYRTNVTSGAGYVTAKHLTTGKRARVSWNYELSEEENHIQAVVKLIGRRPELRTSVDGRGYIFVSDPANDPPESE